MFSHLFQHLARLFGLVELGELYHDARTQPGAEVGRASTQEAKLLAVPGIGGWQEGTGGKWSATGIYLHTQGGYGFTGDESVRTVVDYVFFS